MIGLRSRLAVALLVFGLCLVYALPSVPYIGTALENVLPSKKINLGLDLKGGIHLTLGVDVAKAVSNSLALAGQDIRRLAKDEKIVVLHPRVVGNDKLEFALPRVNDEAKLQEILQKNFPQLNVGEPRRTEAGLRYVAEFRPEEISRIEDMALDQALRTIRNRIDQFGVAEPDIRKQEGNRIQVQLPGLSDPRRAVQILGQTAHLEFHLVRDDVDPNKAVLPSGVMALPLLGSDKRLAFALNFRQHLRIEAVGLFLRPVLGFRWPGIQQAEERYVFTLLAQTRRNALRQRAAEGIAEQVIRPLRLLLTQRVQMMFDHRIEIRTLLHRPLRPGRLNADD